MLSSVSLTMASIEVASVDMVKAEITEKSSI